METCSVTGCHRSFLAKGWCSLHYNRARRNGGNPEARQRLRGESPEDRFWARVDASGPCWLWTAYTVDGYGRFTVTRGDTRIAHRYAWELLVGPISEGKVMDHLCRVRACVNPDHLELVSPWENTLRGENHAGRAKRLDKCKHGHSLEDARVYRGRRMCRECSRIGNRKYKARKRAAEGPGEG